MSAAVALTFHALRQDGVIDNEGEFPMPALDGVHWLGGTDTHWSPHGHARADLTRCLWLGLWADAERAADAVRRADDWLPGRRDAAAHWSVALQPYLSRGEVNWHAGATLGPVCEPAPARPGKEQPIVTVTSFGLSTGRDSFRAFGERLYAARESLRAAPGQRAEFELNAIAPAFSDPCTVTLWRCEADAMAWAYAQAPHRPSMEWAQAGRIFERSSFTRATVVAESGAWPHG
jgi:hypothetical protein